MKKIIALMLALVLVFSFSAMAFADDEITVKLDGEKIEFDVQPQIINDRTMVPMRKIFEALGAQVQWIEALRGIVASKDSMFIMMVIDSKLMLATDILKGNDGENRITLDVPPQIVEDRTLVPLRAISESLNLDVEWVAETREVLITSK